MKSVKIGGVEYVPKNSTVPLAVEASKLKGKEYKIVRTYSAGVFAGYLEKRKGKEVTLINARRLWYWKGAASLSQLAMEGVKNPDECKFAMPVIEVVLTEVIEILTVTKEAKANIDSVKYWKNE